jgi:hypothetical protein
MGKGCLLRGTTNACNRMCAVLGDNIIWVQPAGVVATCKFILMMHFDKRVECLGFMQIVVS